MLRFYGVVAARVHRLVSLMPNTQHDVPELKIGPERTDVPGRRDLEAQRHFDIREYTDTHHDNAVVPPHPDLSRASDREGLRGLLVLGPSIRPSSSGSTSRSCSSRTKTTSTRTTPEARGAWRRQMPTPPERI